MDQDQDLANTPNIYFKVWCCLAGTDHPSSFPVRILTTKTVANLKDAIKKRKPNVPGGIDPDNLDLYKAIIPDDGNLGKRIDDFCGKIKEGAEKRLPVTRKISKVFSQEELVEETVHIVVILPTDDHVNKRRKIDFPYFVDASASQFSLMQVGHFDLT